MEMQQIDLERKKGTEVMLETNSVVAIYDTHSQAEEAVKELQRSGFDMKKLSIVGKDYHTDEQVVGYYNTGDRMKYWGKMGAFWGGLWGMLFGPLSSSFRASGRYWWPARWSPGSSAHWKAPSWWAD